MATPTTRPRPDVSFLTFDTCLRKGPGLVLRASRSTAGHSYAAPKLPTTPAANHLSKHAGLPGTCPEFSQASIHFAQYSPSPYQAVFLRKTNSLFRNRLSEEEAVRRFRGEATVSCVPPPLPTKMARKPFYTFLVTPPPLPPHFPPREPNCLSEL